MIALVNESVNCRLIEKSSVKHLCQCTSGLGLSLLGDLLALKGTMNHCTQSLNLYSEMCGFHHLLSLIFTMENIGLVQTAL